MSSVLKYIGGIICFAGYTICASAQCPDRAVLWDRISFLRDPTTTPADAQLAELLPYVEKMRRCNYVRDSTYAALLHGSARFIMRNPIGNAPLTICGNPSR